MDLVIDNVHGHGNASEEYVLLRARADCDVGRYIIVDNTYYEPNMVSNRLRHSFWFPDKLIRKGDFVSLRTGHGRDTTVAMADGTPIHRFFWRLDSPVWNDSGDAITLIHAAAWTSRRVIR